MQLLSLVLAGFIATTMAFPAPLTSRSDTPIDNSTFCSDHNAALANAIGRMCSREGGLVVGNDWTISESDKEFKHDPHPAEVVVQGSCDSDGNGPPENVTDVCMEIFWALCRARIENGRRGVGLERGKNNCQYWFIPGWDPDYFSGFDWDDLEYLDMEDLLPAEVAAPAKSKSAAPTSPSSLSSAIAATTIQPTPSSVTKGGISGDAIATLLSLALAVPTPKATANSVTGYAGHRNHTSSSHAASPNAHSSRTTASPQKVSTSPNARSSRTTASPQRVSTSPNASSPHTTASPQRVSMSGGSSRPTSRIS